MAVPWFALQVRSLREKAISLSLAQKTNAVFLPTLKRTQRGYDRMRIKDIPLFPGYLFCRLDLSNRLPVLMTPGVIRIVGSAGIPIPVDDDEIAAIQAVVASGRTLQPLPFLRLGERVWINGGPLHGIDGILVSIKNSRRLVVSVSLLQRSVAVELDSERVISAGEDSARVVVPPPKAVFQTALSIPA